mmetsp:Transcript_149387/g.362843  ORF Transcript_149387/g.362843 Transcript_149387/m.362843 type:complete len:115 (-) Transcript_149387:853-1197(-)
MCGHDMWMAKVPQDPKLVAELWQPVQGVAAEPPSWALHGNAHATEDAPHNHSKGTTPQAMVMQDLNFPLIDAPVLSCAKLGNVGERGNDTCSIRVKWIVLEWIKHFATGSARRL